MKVTSVVQGAKSRTGRLVTSDPALLRRTDSAPVNVMVKLDYDSDVRNVLSVDGVAAVQSDALEQPQTSVTPEFLGATNVYPSLGGRNKAGQGVIVGVLDTGITPEHPSFRDPGIDPPRGGPYACQFGDGSDPKLGPPAQCNDKLIGAWIVLEWDAVPVFGTGQPRSFQIWIRTGDTEDVTYAYGDVGTAGATAATRSLPARGEVGRRRRARHDDRRRQPHGQAPLSGRAIGGARRSGPPPISSSC